MVGITGGRVFILQVIESIWKIILPNNFHFKDLFVYSVLIRGIKKKKEKKKRKAYLLAYQPISYRARF